MATVTMNTRLSKILKDKQLNPKQFAISCGIQYGVIQKLMRGEGIQTSIRTLGKILLSLDCEFFDVFPKGQFEATELAIKQRKLLLEKQEMFELKKQMQEMQGFMLKQATIIEELTRKTKEN